MKRISMLSAVTAFAEDLADAVAAFATDNGS